MKKHILVIGAGLSSSYLIKYLLAHAQEQNWHITVADTNKESAEGRVKEHPCGTATALNVNDSYEMEIAVQHADLIISLLPPAMHTGVAKCCVKSKKHLITASYISHEMHSLHLEAVKNNVLLLNEIGLDPGIDHLSAMKLIHYIKAQKGVIQCFKSHCGGLVAPEYDNNSWNYKFTWNPRNVVLAGQATAQYLEDGELKFIPPSRIFTQTQSIDIERYGSFESYANRDSLSYIKPYGIQSAQTVFRGTLRRQGFSANWNHIIKLGLTDDTFIIRHADKLTYRVWLSSFVPGHNTQKLEERVCGFLDIAPTSEAFAKLKWLGLFDETKINLAEGTPAQILQLLLQQKWKLHTGELDMIVMHHELTYTLNGRQYEATSSLVVKGEDQTYTAMAKTVGLPMAIAAKLILNGQLKSRGVQMPLAAEFYTPILYELEQFGVCFTEKVKEVGITS